MGLQRIQGAIKDKTMKCPSCHQPVKQYEKYVDMVASVWDGPGDTRTETSGSKVTLICGNDGCDWKERTEFWEQFID
jgi:hypothetical protein